MKRRKAKKPKSLKRSLIRLGVCLCVIAVLFTSAYYILGVNTWADLTPEKITDVQESLRIYDRNGKLISLLNAGENRTKIEIETLPDYVKYAFISAEDARFYSHEGVDIKRIFGALLADLKAGYFKEGASTITQQLIKNSHLTSEKTLPRKLQEAVLAYQLEQMYEKDEILEMYLNYIYFGNRAYGIESAAQTYFNKGAAELTLAEAALLAGVIKSPSQYAPHIKPENAVKRRNLVLGLMCEYGYITEEERDNAREEELVLHENPAYEISYGFYIDMLLEESAQALDMEIEELLCSGYSIYANLDSSLQGYLEEVYADDSNFPEAEGDIKPQSAAVVLDNKTGGIVAVMGGRSNDTRFCLNRAYMMKRSPGSTIKPIMVYAPAFEKGILSPASILIDERKSFDGYSPRNFNDKYYGSITVREALIKSLNVPAVETLEMVGIDEAKEYASNLGIPFDEQDKNLALALGGFTYGISPLDLAGAYQALGNNGIQLDTSCIIKICDENGEEIYEPPRNAHQAISRETAFMLSDILEDAAEYGSTAINLNLSFPVSVKTGTVGYTGADGYSDAWTAAYNSDYTIVVWLGYDKTTPEQYLKNGITGSTYPARIAGKLFNYLYSGKQAPEFTAPETVVSMDIDMLTLKNDGVITCATKDTPEIYRMTDYFNVKYAPTQASQYWTEPNPPEELSCYLNELRQPVISFNAEESYVKYKLYRIDKDSHTLIGWAMGESGEALNIIDTAAEPGEHSYYILPEHNDAYRHGTALTGKISQIVTITVP
ncbi:MAG TPA: PBP1A family penicillin-binding protein [Firmicutes bacterium]|nr:PBP1A family penicillin-binding protein [Bacillota bacterium]